MSAFDTIDDARLRNGAGVKWGSLEPDVIGAWVADMDFGVPPAVARAIADIVMSGDLGYPNWPNGNPVIDAFEQRMVEQFDWAPQPGRVWVNTDLIQALQMWIEFATEPGDAIALHVPTYPPFLASLQRAGRTIVPIDVDARVDEPEARGELERRLATRGVRMLVLCNPQNPTGHVFTRTELESFADIADSLDLTVLCDEVHADLVFTPHRHTPFASLGPDAAQRTITITSATKSYNLAAVRLAVSHVGPRHLWDLLASAPLDLYGVPSTLATAATLAAWSESSEWFASLMATLSTNRATVAEWADSRKWITGYNSPDATYLSWLDISGAALGDRPAASLEARARVKLSEGFDFCEHTDIDTSRFVRLNFATSPANLAEILQRIDHAVDEVFR